MKRILPCGWRIKAGAIFADHNSVIKLIKVHQKDMKANIYRLLLIGMVALFAALSSGCKNTAHGAGKDIENMGEKIQEKTQ